MPNIAPLRVVLLGTENTDGTVTGVTTGTSIPVACAGIGIVTFYFRSVGTTSGGTILIEEADFGPKEFPYSGTWSQIASIAVSGFTGGAEQAYHYNDSAYGYLRVRISADVTGGGTILAKLRAQQDS